MKKRIVSAIIMLILGTLTYLGSTFYEIHIPETGAAIQNTGGIASLEEDLPSGDNKDKKDKKEDRGDKEEPVGAAVEGGPFKPDPEELNLAYFFPEDSKDTTDMAQSYAGRIFETMAELDGTWMNSIYAHAGDSPSRLAAQMGHSSQALRGRCYDPGDESQDPSDPKTWRINSFKDIRIMVTDGDGRPISVYSNAIDIMSMANVYAYYHGPEDYGLFLEYVKDLWDSSHSYSVSLSDVYDCPGCLGENTAVQAAREGISAAQEGPGTAGQTSEAGTTVIETDGAEKGTDHTEGANAAGTDAARMAEADAAGADAARMAEADAAGTDAARMAEADAAGIDAARMAEADAAGTDAAYMAEADATGADAARMAEADATGADAARMAEADAAGTDAAYIEAKTTAAVATRADALATNSDAGKTRDLCPGHVDLVIQMKIYGIDERNGLFSRDRIGNSMENIGVNGWEGWTEENIQHARNLSKSDWYKKYGFMTSSLAVMNPLSSSEINAYMEAMPKSLSPQRQKIVRFALASVGKVPYYWGGKASYAGYGQNQFGSLVAADSKGRVLKGLDCSGWVSWVYWSATGQRLPYESTSGLASLGKGITKDQLQPGDIILRTGEDAHVIMFLGWTEDGRIRCIHESSYGINNVTVATRDLDWPYYRSLVDDEE